MQALIFNGRVVQVADETFPVAPALTWEAVPSGTTVEVGYTYDGSAFADPDALTAAQQAAAAQAQLKQQALNALSQSDVTVLRCYENAVTVPAEWTAYRKALRAIVDAPSSATALPAMPAYPAGTA